MATHSRMESHPGLRMHCAIGDNPNVSRFGRCFVGREGV